jgi:hypothetical protein
MDMQVALPTPYVGWWPEAPANEYARLAEHRRHMFALIGEFRQAVAQPRGRKDAIRILKEILPCSDAYFAVIESLLDKISAAGATPHRDLHRRILDELRCTLEHCAVSAGEGAGTDLAHALDTLVIHEATIRLRAPENRFLTR